MQLEMQELQVSGLATWKILKRGTEICIVDELGRCRHRSKDQMTTAVHLAMRLAETPLVILDLADQDLRAEVEKFERGEI